MNWYPGEWPPRAAKNRKSVGGHAVLTDDGSLLPSVGVLAGDVVQKGAMEDQSHVPPEGSTVSFSSW